MSYQDLCLEYGVSIAPEGHHHTTPNRVQSDCPHCSPNSNAYRLGFNLVTKRYACWSCGSVDLYGTLQLLFNETDTKVREIARQLRGTDYTSKVDTSKVRGKLVIPKGVGPLLPCHRKYLKGRGFNPDELEKVWGIKGIGIDARLPWRIWIPIHQKNQIVSWTTRSIKKDEIKRYKTARPEEELVNHKHVVFGADKCKNSALICEGPVDAMKIGSGAVALFGLQFSTPQILALSRFSKRIICLDNEPQAQQKASQLCDILEGFPGSTINVTLDAKDASEASEKELNQLRRMLR